MPQHTSTELRQAADTTRKITLEHFYGWSAPSCREKHRPVKLRYREERPSPDIFRPTKEGTWKGRNVTLLQAINEAQPRLYVEPSNQLAEPSYLLEYPDREKLPLAFELTFGNEPYRERRRANDVS